VELAFLRRVCNADAKPFAEVAKAAKTPLHDAVREYAISQNARMRQGNRNIADAPDPRSQVQRVLAPLVESKLGSEQARHYREECAQRAASRKRAVVLNLVAALERAARPHGRTAGKIGSVAVFRLSERLGTVVANLCFQRPVFACDPRRSGCPAAQRQTGKRLATASEAERKWFLGSSVRSARNCRRSGRDSRNRSTCRGGPG